MHTSLPVGLPTHCLSSPDQTVSFREAGISPAQLSTASCLQHLRLFVPGMWRELTREYRPPGDWTSTGSGLYLRLSHYPPRSSALWNHESSSSKGCLRTHSVPGAVLGAGNPARRKVEKNSYSHRGYFLIRQGDKRTCQPTAHGMENT